MSFIAASEDLNMGRLVPVDNQVAVQIVCQDSHEAVYHSAQAISYAKKLLAELQLSGQAPVATGLAYVKNWRLQPPASFRVTYSRTMDQNRASCKRKLSCR